MALAHPNKGSLPVAEPRRRSRGRRLDELLQAEKQLPGALENDHEIDSFIHVRDAALPQGLVRRGRRLMSIVVRPLAFATASCRSSAETKVLQWARCAAATCSRSRLRAGCLAV